MKKGVRVMDPKTGHRGTITKIENIVMVWVIFDNKIEHVERIDTSLELLKGIDALKPGDWFESEGICAIEVIQIDRNFVFASGIRGVSSIFTFQQLKNENIKIITNPNIKEPEKVDEIPGFEGTMDMLGGLSIRKPLKVYLCKNCTKMAVDNLNDTCEDCKPKWEPNEGEYIKVKGLQNTGGPREKMKFLIGKTFKVEIITCDSHVILSGYDTWAISFEDIEPSTKEAYDKDWPKYHDITPEEFKEWWGKEVFVFAVGGKPLIKRLVGFNDELPQPYIDSDGSNWRGASLTNPITGLTVEKTKEKESE